jgi:hypothetical protein
MRKLSSTKWAITMVVTGIMVAGVQSILPCMGSFLSLLPSRVVEYPCRRNMAVE